MELASLLTLPIPDIPTWPGSHMNHSDFPPQLPLSVLRERFALSHFPGAVCHDDVFKAGFLGLNTSTSSTFACA
eukprot:2748248-Pleurochrysis_carterae.AAC.3